MKPGWTPVSTSVEVSGRALQNSRLSLVSAKSPPMCRRGVQVGDQVLLACPANLDAAVRCDGSRGEGGDLDAVGDGGVLDTAQFADSLDGDGPVGVDRDEGAHFLQHEDQVHDLGLDGRVGDHGGSKGADCRQ
jgi:hypothetical protein